MTGATLDIFDSKTKADYGKEAQQFASQIDDLVIIEKVPASRTRYGMVPVSPGAVAENNHSHGCDVGVNGSDLSKLSKIGGDLYKSKNLKILFGALDIAMAGVARRLCRLVSRRVSSPGKRQLE